MSTLHRPEERTSRLAWEPSAGAGAGATDSRRQSTAGALADELRHAIEGEVRFDDGSRALYATDSSNYRQVPIGVVIPKTVEDVVRTVEVCGRHRAPILARGGGTSLAGQCCNVAVVMDMSKYLHRVLELDPNRRLARIQPGIVLDDLRQRAEEFHLTFGPDPSTHNHCTLGGMIGNNSCGVHSMMAGRTSENVAELEILTYDGLRLRVGKTSDAELDGIIRRGGRRGEIYSRLKALRDRYAGLIRARFPKIPRRVSGYNLDELLPESGFNVARALVGSECTCVLTLEATVRLVHSPPTRSLVILGYPDVYSAGDHIPVIREFAPIGLEGLDDVLVDHMKRKGLHPESAGELPEGKGWLLVEFGGESKRESDERAQSMIEALRKRPDPPSMKLYDDPALEKKIWEVREAGLGATARVPGERDTWEGWEDSAVPPDKLGVYLRELRQLFRKYEYACALYGHFGQGCVHTRIDFDLTTNEGISKYRSFVHEAADLVVKHGGSFSGEHGDGQSRAELLPKMYGPELVEAFREFKRIWDPENRMNPGKIVDAYRMDENLRLGAGFRPAQPDTYFQFPEDKGSIGYAALRCVGVGTCRREQGGVMCPSYMVTREEMHSTRGRAHLLFEMLHKGTLQGGWRDDHLREALDLCLSCKGCKSDCPLNVDMATYKAEFLAHYYEGKLRPASAYSMGLIHWWARFASLAPDLANLLTHLPPFSNLAKRLGGIAPRRKIPAFARETFKSWYKRRGTHRPNGAKVILWADTFNNYFEPQVAIAAVEVLESIGYRVEVPQAPLCCGRPLYDYGWLGLAQKLLRQILVHLEKEIRAGTPLIVLEPSCAATFKDELLGMFPREPLAQWLNKQTYFFSDFLKEHLVQPLTAPGSALFHGHCHERAIFRTTGSEDVLRAIGVNFEIPDSGCCGMAGAFGYEKSHYDVSMRVGERALLPAVRRASRGTVLIANGFSCREQIRQSTGRTAVHVAQVVQRALPKRTAPVRRRRLPATSWLALGLAGLWLASRFSRRAPRAMAWPTWLVFGKVRGGRRSTLSNWAR